MLWAGRVVVAAVGAVLLAGCSVVVGGVPSPVRGVVADLPFDEAERIFAEQMAIFRSWDVCAMVDIAAAERAGGTVAFAVRPTRGFDGCEVAMEVPDTDRFSYLSTEVAAVRPGGGPDVEIAGRRYPAVEPAEDAGDRAECGYARPFGSGWGVIVRGEVVDDPDASCALARDYLADVATRIDDPPLRAAAGTDPAFALGEQDPCATLAAVVPDAADVTVTGPRRCAAGGVEIGFSLAQFETDVVGTAGVRPGGRLDSVDEGPGACTVTRQASDTTLLAPSLPYLYRETLSVSAPDCATARDLGETVERTLPGPATPQTGAFALGSLEDFPEADDVGAPFDPCRTVGWSAFPADVRPEGIDPHPFPSPIEVDTRYRVGCDYTSDAIAAVVSWGPADGGYSADPAVRPGTATRFAGRPGLEDRPVPGPGQPPLCLSTMQIGNGVAGVISVARESRADLCAVNRGVLETLAPLVP